VGPRTGLDAAEKILDPIGTLTLPVIQPVTSGYTDCDIPALIRMEYETDMAI
jgi:hypothetical protein